MAKVPNLRNFSPDAGDAKHVDDTKMLNTVARESMDHNESNEVGKEYSSGSGEVAGPFGAVGRE